MRSVKAAMAWPAGRRAASRRRRSPKRSASARRMRPSAGSWKPAAQSPVMTPSPSPLQSVAPGQGSRSCSRGCPGGGRPAARRPRRDARRSPRPPAAHLLRQLFEAALEAAHRARAHGTPRRGPGAALEQRQLEPLEARESLRERHGRGRVLRWALRGARDRRDDQCVARQPGRRDGRGRVHVERQDERPRRRTRPSAGWSDRKGAATPPRRPRIRPAHGCPWVGEKMSTMPPRRLHCPTSTTVSTRS